MNMRMSLLLCSRSLVFIQAPLWYMHHSSMTGQRRSSILTRHFFKTWVSFGSGCSWKLEGRYRQELDGPGLHTGSPGLKRLIWGLSSAFTCLCVALQVYKAARNCGRFWRGRDTQGWVWTGSYSGLWVGGQTIGGREPVRGACLCVWWSWFGISMHIGDL